MYRFILRGFDKKPTQEDINNFGQIPVIERNGYITDNVDFFLCHKSSPSCVIIEDDLGKSFFLRLLQQPHFYVSLQFVV